MVSSYLLPTATFASCRALPLGLFATACMPAVISGAATTQAPHETGRHLGLRAQPSLSCGGIAGYPREAFIVDLIDEAETDIRGALDAGAATSRSTLPKAGSPSSSTLGHLLRSFVALNNQVLDRFTPDERRSIGVHVCPGGDHDSTHSADVDYAGLLPDLFQNERRPLLSPDGERARPQANPGNHAQTGETEAYSSSSA